MIERLLSATRPEPSQTKLKTDWFNRDGNIAYSPIRQRDGTDEIYTIYLHDFGLRPRLPREQELHLGQQILKGRLAQRTLGNDPPESLPPQEAKILAEQITRGKQAQNQLVEASLRLVIRIAERYSNRGLSFYDLIQEGNLGLIAAAKKVDLTTGFRFSTYATYWVVGKISLALKSHSHAIRIPLDMITQVKKFGQIEQQLIEQNSGQPVSSEKVFDFMGIASKKKRETIALACTAISKPISLQHTDFEGHKIESIIPDKNPSPSNVIEKKELEEKIESILRSPNFLSAKETRVLQLKFGFDFHHPREHNNSQIGNRFGLTREGIRLIEQKALEKLSQLPEVQALKVYLER